MSFRARALAGWRGLLVFIGLVVVLVACSQAPTPVVAPSVSPSPTPTPTATPSPTPTAKPTPKATPAPPRLNRSLLHRRLTILVLGNDGNKDRLARHPDTRTDAMVLVSINATHRVMSMTSLPRDYVDIPLGDGRVWTSKVNGIAYTLGDAGLVRALKATYQTKIDYYVDVNMGDFAKLINAIHGISIKVPRAIYDPSIGFQITAGRHHLGGKAALGYARSRHTTSDYDRAARQQLVLLALMRKLLNPKTKIHLFKLLNALRSFKTDMHLGDMPTFFAIARKAVKARVIRRVLAPPTFATFWGIDPYGRGWIIQPNLAAMRAYIHSVIP